MAKKDFYFREKTDWRLLAKVEQQVTQAAYTTNYDIAEAIKNDIRANWSPMRPSSRGNPPAVDTGNLDSSIFVEETGRDLRGRFARWDKAAASIIIDTERGDIPMGRGQYAGVLEMTPQYDRPFLQPALNRASNRYGVVFKRRWGNG